MTRIFLIFIFLVSSISFAANRPLRAITLKEGNTCRLACASIHDREASDLQSCVKRCKADTRVRGGFPLDWPKISKQLQSPGVPSSKM